MKLPTTSVTLLQKPRERAGGPTSIVIFGVTGDLAGRKLLPALWNLYIKEYLPNEFAVIGFARRALSDKDLRAYVKDTLVGKKLAEESDPRLAAFLNTISYVAGNFDDQAAYATLASALAREDERWGRCGDKLFHLAVPPAFYDGIFKLLHGSGLADSCGGVGGWTRILVEKPFGNDLETARALDATLGSLFREEQIFRVDHYMGKETIQNILAFRFSNALLEHLWNRLYIERVHLRLFETLGIEGRGAFYDGVGALRDVGENHLLQMFAFIAMEDPGVLEAGALRAARAAALSALRAPAPQGLARAARRGQYRGFREEQNVRPDSQTETYFRIEAFSESDRWRGVPFYFESGKKLCESKAEIEIVFRKKESCLCPPGAEMHPQNRLVFRIQPNEGIDIAFFAKRPGFDMAVEEKTLSFSYGASDAPSAPDAYERVIFDGITGDQTLFTSTDEVRSSWEFITPILREWDAVPLAEYEPGFAPDG